jgi:hypothetical protein
MNFQRRIISSVCSSFTPLFYYFHPFCNFTCFLRSAFETVHKIMLLFYWEHNFGHGDATYVSTWKLHGNGARTISHKHTVTGKPSLVEQQAYRSIQCCNWWSSTQVTSWTDTITDIPTTAYDQKVLKWLLFNAKSYCFLFSHSLQQYNTVARKICKLRIIWLCKKKQYLP